MVDCHVKRHNYIVGDHLSKEEGKDKETIQSSTAPETGHHMGNTKHNKTSNTREPRG